MYQLKKIYNQPKTEIRNHEVKIKVVGFSFVKVKVIWNDNVF